MSAESIMKKCQIGCNNLNDANNLLAECYGSIGFLSAQRDELLAALKRIESWNETSLEFNINNGSNGQRDYYINIARGVIAKCEAQS